MLRRVAHGIIPSLGSISPNARRLLLGNLLSATGQGAVGVVYNLYLVDLHQGLDIIGLLSAISTVAVAVTALFSGLLLRRWPARRIMLAGTAVLAAAIIGPALLTNRAALVAFSIMGGIGAALASNLVGYTLMEEGPPEQQAHLFSAYFAVVSGGGMVGGLLSSLVALFATMFSLPGGGDSVLAHRLVLVGGGLMSMLAVPFLAAMTAPRPLDESAGGRRVRRTAAPPRANPERDLAAILVAVAFLAASLGLAMPFINVYFAQVAHATTSQIGLIFSVAAGIATLTTFGGPALAQRFGKLPTFVGARLITAPCLLLLAWHVPLGLAAAAFLMRNIMGNISGALDTNYMLEVLPPALRARASGWRTAVFNAATALTSYGAGILLTRVGYTPLFATAAALTVVSMVVYASYFHFAPVLPAPRPPAPEVPLERRRASDTPRAR
ncbi:MAG: hypothetical protein NVSMB65_19600 [Chloroflexota bacterium]